MDVLWKSVQYMLISSVRTPASDRGRKVETEKIEDGNENENEFDVKPCGHKAGRDGSLHEESIRDAGEGLGDLILAFREGLRDVDRSARICGVIELIGCSF